MAGQLVVDVDDLVGHLEARREVDGAEQVSLRLGDAVVSGPMSVDAVVSGVVDGVMATFTARAPIELVCVRCLTRWRDELVAEGSQHFSRLPDEDGYAIVGRQVDLAGPAVDELALAMPAAPLCRPDCKGLCPICGTDLNSDPCDGHGEDSDSPFAALKDLFDPD